MPSQKVGSLVGSQRLFDEAIAASGWARRRRGVFRLAGDTVEHRHARSVLDSMTISTLFEDPGGRLWIGTDAGVWLDDGRLRRVPTTGQPLFNTSLRPGFPVSAVPRSPRVCFIASIATGAVELIRAAIGPVTDVPLRTDADGAVWHAADVGCIATRDLCSRSHRVRRRSSALDGHVARFDREGASGWARAPAAASGEPALFTTLSRPEGLIEANPYRSTDRSDAIGLAAFDGVITSPPTGV